MSANLYLYRRTVDPDFPQLANFKSIPWPHHRRRSVLFDHRRPDAAEARLQCISVKYLRVYPATCVSNIDFAFLCRLGFRRSARQARDLRLLQSSESGQMQRLKFGRRFGVGVAVAALVVALEGRANLLHVF